MTDPALAISIEPVWGTIRDTRDKVGVLLTGYSEVLRSAVMMTASELLENAVKYGDSVAGAPRILFSLGLADGVVQIRTVNGSSDQYTVQRLRDRLHQLEAAEDPTTLYVNAIEESLSYPAGHRGGGLGIYRIVVEGGFALSCHYDDGVVNVLATRSIA